MGTYQVYEQGPEGSRRELQAFLFPSDADRYAARIAQDYHAVGYRVTRLPHGYRCQAPRLRAATFRVEVERLP